ncbi:hypothetical protein G9G63_09165 [Paenibacillus sp. EKM202P]|uniref:hypothetical protein n=1 Tax=unclassified Paenibacillus TaxID=185978 RepID=UPI0013EC4D7F|nr:MULTISPECIES: hypothetical protein [unclassified Paenibacillus]KAF6565319.1 hypothetical protein G9G63_09165 [Paenibacillus sp. EKM202P]KAF6569355.1 hypothetical protein G9G64_12925 [Paenibacillus sp. EKM207P]
MKNKQKDYSYLKDTYVEIARSDNEYNQGSQAKVLEVKDDCLRVLVEDNGEEFWTDVNSVYHDPDTRKHPIQTDEGFYARFYYLQQEIKGLSSRFQNPNTQMSPWEIEGWMKMAKTTKQSFEALIDEAAERMEKR